MRHAFDNQPHFAFENVNDLLLRMRVCRHLTSGGECGEHLIHRVAMCDGPARDSRTNFNRRILSFHGQNRYDRGSDRANLLGVIVAATWIRRLAETNQFVHRLEFIFLVSWFLIRLALMTCHPPPISGNMPP